MALLVMIPRGHKEVTVNGLHQWDYGQKLEIHDADLPAVVRVHFACVGMEEAIVRACSSENGVAEVAVPDRCLEQPAPITAWIYAEDETSGATIKTITLVVTPRARPQPGVTPPEDFSDTCAELIAAVNALVESLKAGAVTVNNAQRAENAAWADNALYAENAQNATFAGKATTADKATNATRAESSGSADFAGTAEFANAATYDGAGNVIADTYRKKTEPVMEVFTSRRADVNTIVMGTGYDNRIPIGLMPEGKALSNVCAIAFSTTYKINDESRVFHFHGFVQALAQNTEGFQHEIVCEMVPRVDATLKSITSGSVSIYLAVYDRQLHFIYKDMSAATIERNTDGTIQFNTSPAAVVGATLDTVEVFYR